MAQLSPVAVALASPRADEVAPTVVMKFGGSSVADPARIARVAERLVAAKARGVGVVGVVSAMGPIKISFYVPAPTVDETVRALHARLRPGLRAA